MNPRQRTLGIALLTVAVWATSSQAEEPDEVELGRRLYEQGLGRDGAAVTAIIAAPDPEQPGVEMPATALPCGSCHGADGRGRPEGGTDPADLRWSTLTRPWQLTTPSGRRRGPYDERSLVRAVTLGFDSAGHRLGLAMPRYRLSQADARALLTYLRFLDRRRAPGIGDDRVSIGLLKPKSPSDESQAAAAVLRAWQAEMAAGGGIHGRRPQLLESVSSESEVALWIVLPGAPPPHSSEVPVLLLGEPDPGCRACVVIEAKEPSEVRDAHRRHLARRHNLGAEHPEVQSLALDAATATTRALEAAGRQLDAESLLATLRR